MGIPQFPGSVAPTSKSETSFPNVIFQWLTRPQRRGHCGAGVPIPVESCLPVCFPDATVAPGVASLFAWQAIMASTWSAQVASAASVSSSRLFSSPLVCGLAAGNRQGVSLGQPFTVSTTTGEGGALAQPDNISRQVSISPAFKRVVFML